MSDSDKKDPKAVEAGMPTTNYDSDDISIGQGDILSKEHVDPVLSRKMHLVNNAIDEIGFTGYQVKLFVLNGFGYAVDSLVLLIQSIIAGQARLEFNPTYGSALTIAAYSGMLAGALFWGMSADIIGRRFAFNFSLIICSIFAIVAGAAPNWPVLGLFVALSSFGGGGNLVLDTAVFLEYLPGKQQWLLTLMAAWWGIGQLIAGLFAWAFIPNFRCTEMETCTRENNMGWRYVWFASGALVLVMSLLRVTIIRLKETPKYLIGEGKDAEVVETLQQIAKDYNRPCSLTVEQLTACGVTGSYKGGSSSGSKKRAFGLGEIPIHLRGLFATRRIGISTSLIWFSWTLIGLAYPLYNVFLPDYLQSRGAAVGETSDYIRWRNYAIINMCGIFGPVPAAFMCATKLGRKYTMVIGAMITMIFFFAYTQVRTPAQNLGFNCAINFCLNIYYGTLYAYTPEVLPSAHRGTGNGIAIGFNRIMGILSAVIAEEADTATAVPIFICAALYIIMAMVAAAFPFEPFGKRSS